jgi:hypothetical protein
MTTSGLPIWYPADQLTIVEWLPVKVKIEDPGMSAEMIQVAMRTPAQNQPLILGNRNLAINATLAANITQPQLRNARYPLGIAPGGQQQMFQVRFQQAVFLRTGI